MQPHLHAANIAAPTPFAAGKRMVASNGRLLHQIKQHDCLKDILFSYAYHHHRDIDRLPIDGGENNSPAFLSKGYTTCCGRRY